MQSDPNKPRPHSIVQRIQNLPTLPEVGKKILTLAAKPDVSIAELDKEIENLLFETRVRKEVVSDTVATLLERAAAKRQSSLTVPEVPTLDPNPLRGGRVQ